MRTRFQVLILVLPGILLIQRGHSANSLAKNHQALNFGLDMLAKDEGALTRLDDTVVTTDEDSKLNIQAAPPSITYAAEDNHRTIKDQETYNFSAGVPPAKESVLLKKLGFISNGNGQTSPLDRSFTVNHSHQKWGSHPIGMKDSFMIHRTTGNPKWIAYFYDQGVAAVLHENDGTMIKCTVQENIEEWEQKAALQYLGEIMPLQPIPFNAMVHLITLCGTLNMPPPATTSSTASKSRNIWWLDLSAIQGILPGTLWCGMQDQATYYHQLGSKYKVDSCCRAHDHCPIKLSPLATRYGVTNFNIRSILHCSCDLEFFRCLKAARNPTADMVGQMYFNILKTKCLDAPDPQIHYERPQSRSLFTPKPRKRPMERSNTPAWMECTNADREGGCRKWVLHPKNFTIHLVISDLGLNY